MKGYNLGILHHAAYLQFREDGYLPTDFVQKIKEAVPEDMRSFCRMTGTQSNTMRLDAVGYNNPQLEQQLRNQRIALPRESYWHPFVRFYQVWDFKGVAITVNSHSSYNDKTGETDIAAIQRDVIGLLAFLVQNKVNIVCVELENEGYLYANITGLSGGSPNLWERLQYGRNIESIIYNKCLLWQDHLKRVADAIRKDWKNLPIGVSVGKPDNMRSRLYNQAVLKEIYYDFLVPHIYVTNATPQGVMEEVRQHITPLPTNIEKRVTEFQWNYQAQPKGHNLTDAQLLANFEKAFEAYGITHYFWHCLWNRFDANGWARNIKI